MKCKAKVNQYLNTNFSCHQNIAINDFIQIQGKKQKKKSELNYLFFLSLFCISFRLKINNYF